MLLNTKAAEACDKEVKMRTRSIVAVIMGVLLIISGFLCIFHPAMTLGTIPWLIGLDMVFDGVGELCTWSDRKARGGAGGLALAGAILSLLCGIALFISFAARLLAAEFVIFFVAVWILLLGIIRIVKAFQLKKAPVEELANKWWIALVMGITLVICGIFSICNPLVLGLVIGINLGVMVLIAGINLVTVATAG